MNSLGMRRLFTFAIGPVVLSSAFAQELRSSLPIDIDCREARSAKTQECYQPDDPVFRLSNAQATPLNGDQQRRAVIEYFSNEPWAKSGELPQVGLALSGGGSKMAPFAIGVIKRFADEGWISDTDVISSVSGGGYAAYYLYAQAWATKAHPREMSEYRKMSEIGRVTRVPRVKDLFGDVRNEKYGEHRTSEGLARSTVYGPDERVYGRIDSPTGEQCREFPLNTTRHQLFLECYQDVLSRLPGGVSTNIDAPPYGAYFKGGIATIASLPVHHFANSIFDWKLPLTPTQYIYQHGIARTYGTVPAAGEQSRNLQLSGEFGFEELRSLYAGDGCVGDPCTKMPWWVINTTNAVEAKDREDLSKAVFEITANSFGSGNYGYVRGQSIDVVKAGFRPIHAVAASAAFFDSLSPGEHYGLSPTWQFVALHAVNLRWGLEVPNYRVPNRARVIHALLPWPLYYMHRFRRNAESTHIRLADGGQSGDNLGVFSMLRRGVRNIVVADGAYDKDADGTTTLSELCLIGKLLGARGLDIQFDGLPGDASDNRVWTTSQFCSDEVAGLKPEFRSKFSPYHWQRPVWVGVIHPSVAAAKGDDVLDGVRIFYIKAAVDGEKILDAIQNWKNTPDICNGELGHNYAKFGFPCGLVGYRIDAARCGKAEGTCSDAIENWEWPQTSTAATTADSSANRFEAYRDLGWYLTGHLACVAGMPFEDKNRCTTAAGVAFPEEAQDAAAP